MSKRQAEIVDAAIRLLATQGARRFTVALLAAEIGVTGGAIYRHFESMEAIVDAVVERVGSILFEGFPPAAVDPIERLRLFFHNRTRTILANPHLSRMLLSDHLSQTAAPGQVERLEEFKRRSQRFVIGCLREAKQNGTLAAKLSPEAGAVIVLGPVLALAHVSTRLAGMTGLEQLADEVWSTIEHMLRATSPSGAATRLPKPRQRRRATEKE